MASITNNKFKFKWVPIQQMFFRYLLVDLNTKWNLPHGYFWTTLYEWNITTDRNLKTNKYDHSLRKWPGTKLELMLLKQRVRGISDFVFLRSLLESYSIWSSGEMSKRHAHTNAFSLFHSTYERGEAYDCYLSN